MALVVCGVCKSGPPSRPTGYVANVPVGKGFAPFDPRPRTPTGGRLGIGVSKFRKFVKHERVSVCISCALKLSTSLVEWPGKSKFEARCKKHG